tara:strand:+ start:1582 stop:8949 length:7368 start_codon:yes stop_codon:yes gene_type:complete
MTSLIERINSLSDDKKALLANKLAPASFGQQRLWFINQLQPESTAYHLFTSVSFTGDFCIDSFQKAITTVVNRHDNLRTSFLLFDNSIRQLVHPKTDFPMGFANLSDCDEIERKRCLDDIAHKQCSQVFDLESGPLIRVMVIRTAADEHVLFLTLHHIIFDGWSKQILLNELSAEYQAVKQGSRAELPKLAYQYGDFARWQQQLISGTNLAKQLDYWSDKLADITPKVLLHDRPVKNEGEHHGLNISFRCPKATREKVAAICRENEITPFMFFISIYFLLIHKYTNQSDVTIGTPIAGRNKSEFEGLIGFFVNTLVLRSITDPLQPLKNFFQTIKKTAFDAFAHQDLPYERIVDAIRKETKSDITSLFQIMFSMQNVTHDEKSMFADLQVKPVDFNPPSAQFDLTLNINLSDELIHGVFEYDNNAFESKTIVDLAQYYQTLIEQVADNPEVNVGQLSLITRQQQLKQLEEFNPQPVIEVEELLLHQAFEQHALNQPDSVALTCDGLKLSYTVLNQRANQIAYKLISLGVTPDTKVAIYLNRGPAMITAILAALKAGAAYVPLDPEYPADRLRYIIQDCQPSACLYEDALASNLEGIITASPATAVLSVDEADLAAMPTDNIDHRTLALNPLHTAYVIYTSGSTGRPKGVMVAHQNIANLIQAWQHQDRHMLAEPARQYAVWTNIGFDVSVFEIFNPLTSGATLHIVPPQIRADEQAYLNWLTEHAIEVAYFPPFFVNALKQVEEQTLANLRLRRLLVGVEPLEEQALYRLEKLIPGLTITNGYGPTETTVFSTSYSSMSDRQRITPIGKPIENTYVYILDQHGNVTPPRVTGEILIGGRGNARGYLHNPSLTASKYLPDPYSSVPGGRLYRTGDLGHWQTDGNIVFHGRNDHQIKLRGFRIEPGEIEHLINQSQDVTSSLVMATPDDSGQKRLIAYVESALGDQIEQQNNLKMSLRERIKAELPDYMMPAAFIIMPELPLTPNGKVDRKSLPKSAEHFVQAKFIAPSNPTEKTLATIWSKLLNVDIRLIGVNSNYFELGGHSLLAVRLMAQIRVKMQKELPIRVIFDCPTIGTLAEQVDLATKGPLRTPIRAVTRKPEEVVLSSFAQQRLWFIDQLQGGSPEYNMPVALEVSGDFDIEIAEQAIRRIIKRHESLRTVFAANGGDTIQIIKNDFSFNVHHHNLTHLDKHSQSQEVNKLVTADRLKPFDLSHDLMLRVSYLLLSKNRGERETTSNNSKNVLLFNMHHIASDGWSMSVLLKEFVIQYQSITNGKPDPLAPLVIQYADYAIWQREWLSGDVLALQLAFWKRQLADVPATHSLPLCMPRPTTISYKGGLVTQEIGLQYSKPLLQLAADHKLTPFMLLHAVLALTLSRHSNCSDIVIGTPVANRMQVEVEPLIGLFINTLVLRTNSEHGSIIDYLHHVKEVNLSAQAHQDIPFEQLVEHCNLERSTQHPPLFQIMFNMNNNEQSELSLPGIMINPVVNDDQVALYDLDINGNVSDDGIRLSWVYDTSIFTQQYIETISSHMVELLKQIAEKPLGNLNDLQILSSAEREQLLSFSEASTKVYSSDLVIHELIEKQSSNTPDELALVCGAKHLTYKELNDKANRLAHYLREQGVKTNTLVGICLERSAEILVSVLAVLKAGGAYVPIDPAYPKARLNYIAQDADFRFLVSNSKLAEKFSFVRKVLLIDPRKEQLERQLRHYPCGNRVRTMNSANTSLAYVIYTSGSTGEPKGVMVEHGAIASHVQSVIEKFNFSENDKVLQLASFSFDTFAEQTFAALSVGATLVVSENSLIDTQQFFRLVKTHTITITDLTPAYLSQLVALDCRSEWVNSSLTRVVVGGEALNPKIVQAWLDGPQHNSCQLFNAYGPTECVITSSVQQINKQNSELVSIGKALGNRKFYVLDRNLHLCPIGVTGELYIGGDCLASGYLKQHDLTMARFVNNPYATDQSTKMYKTGDLVRYMSDGRLIFVGRADDQLKIRGYRIEPTEVENQISQCNEVAVCRVFSHQGDAGENQLLAYVIPVDSKATERNSSQYESIMKVIKKRLQLTLPNYMHPTSIQMIDNFPMTTHGKIDKSALPLPDGSDISVNYVAPQSKTEKALVTLWAEVLNRSADSISIEANFFELGGHSLLAVQLISKIRQQLQQEISISTLFTEQTLTKLALYLDSDQKMTTTSPLSEYGLMGAVSDMPNVFLAPALGMMGMTYNSIVTELADTLNVKILSTPGIDAQNADDDILELNQDQRLSHWYQAVKSESHSEVYRLIGHSSGGNVVFELARKLESEGKQVELVLLDAYLDAVPDSETESLDQILFDNPITEAPAGQPDATTMSADNLYEKLGALGISGNTFSKDDFEIYYRAAQKQYAISQAYQASGKIKGRITLMIADRGLNSSVYKSKVLKRIQQLSEREPTVITVPGTHTSMINEPQVSIELKSIFSIRSDHTPSRGVIKRENE